MSHNFKRGDLALIIRSRNSENVGRTVTVRAAAKAGEVLIYGGGGFVTCSDGQFVVEGEIVVRALLDHVKKRTVKVHAFSARCLMPLRGDFTHEKQKAKEAEPCA